MQLQGLLLEGAQLVNKGQEEARQGSIGRALVVLATIMCEGSALEGNSEDCWDALLTVRIS